MYVVSVSLNNAESSSIRVTVLSLNPGHTYDSYGFKEINVYLQTGEYSSDNIKCFVLLSRSSFLSFVYFFAFIF